MLILTRQDVASLLTMPAAIAAVAEGFRRLAQGTAVMPQRAATPIAPHHGLHLAMPVFVEGIGPDGALTVKITQRCAGVRRRMAASLICPQELVQVE